MPVRQPHDARLVELFGPASRKCRSGRFAFQSPGTRLACGTTAHGNGQAIMIRHRLGLYSLVLSLLHSLAGAVQPAVTYLPASQVKPPAVLREFRGLWIATVKDLDWPSRPGLSTAQQKAELIALLDQAKLLRFNAVFLQVRPSCDALYASRLEPWSEYLTGQMGRAPEPFYDPLAFAIEQAHRRGLELHAWFNPYRARHATASSPVCPEHISKTRPHLVRAYGKSLWLDPGEREVQEYSLNVVQDVVRRYDVDGVHFDD